DLEIEPRKPALAVGALGCDHPHEGVGAAEEQRRCTEPAGEVSSANVEPTRAPAALVERAATVEVSLAMGTQGPDDRDDDGWNADPQCEARLTRARQLKREVTTGRDRDDDGCEIHGVPH